uniref:Uncharacterized protein n=1 Tax=Podoviridae sp. ctsNK10 TaxID=2826582 RepID=A0A8S5NKC1_9CAUD|nr:MAG TPA: hypothetical protein [Podoviridae sp. ctsNK10]
MNYYTNMHEIILKQVIQDTRLYDYSMEYNYYELYYISICFY